MDFSNFKMPDFSKLINPVIPSIPSPKTLRIVNAIDNIQNINRIRDMDNLLYQISLKENQKNIYEKRLKSIISTIDIKAGSCLSIIIILFSIIVPFLIVSFKDYLKCFHTYIFIYLIVSFIISMLAMSFYLIWFWRK